MNSEPIYGAAEILVIELGYGSVARFFTEEGKVFAFQARAFGNKTPKYYTIKLDEENLIEEGSSATVYKI